MQSLENIGVLEKDEERGGRRITQSGQRDLDREWTIPPWFNKGHRWPLQCRHLWREERRMTVYDAAYGFAD